MKKRPKLEPTRSATATEARASGGAPSRGLPLLPGSATLLDPREPFLIPLVMLLAGRIFFWLYLPSVAEDAYITFRYSRNLALGLGLVYNPGERVMGFTSPLWTLWNALGFLLVRNIPAWSRAWLVAADVVTLLLVTDMLRRHVSRASAWCFAFFFAAWCYFAAVAVSGMENSLMLALVALAAALAERGSRATGPALAALGLVRPEGLAAAAVIALGTLARDRIVALILIGLGLIALAAYFGSPLPQSMVAKARIYGTPGVWSGRHWWEWVVPFALGRWPVASEGTFLYLLAPACAPAAALGAGALWRIRRTGPALAAGAALVVWLGYALLGVAYFNWYLVVPLGGLAIVAAAGLPRVLQGRPVYVGLALFILGTWTVVPKLYGGRMANELLAFGGVADYLAKYAQAGQKVLLEPIGMVGYRCRLILIDEIGLVSPRVAQRRLRGPGWLTDVSRQELPDWLVVRRGVLRDAKAFAGIGAPFRSPAERDSLLTHYEQMTVIYEQGGTGAMTVLRRR